MENVTRIGTCVHGDKRMIINGGWHDAGDLTQGLENTGEITYALLIFAEKLKNRNDKKALYDRLLEEAKWGLDWVLKTSFGDGFRNGGSISSRRTNNIIGDFDDITSTARNSPMTNFESAAVEAIASRVFKSSDPRLADYALKMAKADWKFALEGMSSIKPSQEIWRGSFDSDNVEHELAEQAIIAAIDLWKITNDQQYADKATELASLIVNAQQRQKTDWDVPLTGFYYTTTSKNRLLHYCHRGREQGATLALTALCDAFPNHPDWMKWYAAVTLYSEYIKTISKYTAPYNVLPASVYTDSEYLHVPESRKESFRKQVLNGVPLGKGHYLRLFPVWMDYRGHFGTILPQAQSLESAANLRGDLESAQLSEHQLEWIIGKNPFSQSTMWGEGHDFAPLYTPSSGDIVGALPVGIQSRGEDDAPYWPVQNTWTYKEIWVHPVTRWIWLLKDLFGSAIVNGVADAPIEFKETITGETIIAAPDNTGQFRIELPEGKYTAKSNGVETLQIFLPGQNYQLDFRSNNLLGYELSKINSSKNEIVIQLRAKGNGAHHFVLRTDNLTLTDIRKNVVLKQNSESVIEWRCKISDKETPWVAVVIPDNDMQHRKEIRGSAWEK
ncbi:MAG: glycoside hydrolase family 9 protein [Chitinophagaceae bacterium]